MKCKFKKKKGLKSQLAHKISKRQGVAFGAPIQYGSFNLVTVGICRLAEFTHTGLYYM